MVNLLLVLIARLLLFLIAPLNLVYVVFFEQKFSWKRLNGYFKGEAIAIDRFGNYQYRGLLNKILIKKEGYKFGNFKETISSVLGKNEHLGTLTKTGIILVCILNRIDKNHCQKSINWRV